MGSLLAFDGDDVCGKQRASNTHRVVGSSLFATKNPLLEWASRLEATFNSYPLRLLEIVNNFKTFSVSSSRQQLSTACFSLPVSFLACLPLEHFTAFISFATLYLASRKPWTPSGAQWSWNPKYHNSIFIRLSIDSACNDETCSHQAAELSGSILI